MIKISHPLSSTSSCSPAAACCGIAMEACLFSTQRKQNNRYWQQICFAPPPKKKSLISLPNSISLGPWQIYHIVFLTSSPHCIPLSPVSYYMALPHSLLLPPRLLPTHSISSIPERMRNWGRCTCWLLACVSIPPGGRRGDRQPKQAGRQGRRS